MHEKVLKIISIRKMQFKILMRYNHTSINTVKVKNMTIPNAGWDTEKLDLSHITGGNIQPIWKTA